MWLPVHRALPNQDTLPPPLHHLQMTAFLHRTGNVDRPWNMKKMTNLIHLLNIAWRPRSLFLIFHFQRVQTDKCVFPRIQGTRSFLTLCTTALGYPDAQFCQSGLQTFPSGHLRWTRTRGGLLGRHPRTRHGYQTTCRKHGTVALDKE